MIPRILHPVDCSVVANARAPLSMFTNLDYKFGVTRVQDFQKGIIGRWVTVLSKLFSFLMRLLYATQLVGLPD